MEFLREIPMYWLCLIGFVAYCFVGFFTVLIGVSTGYLTRKSRLEDWRANIPCSVDLYDDEGKQRIRINIMFWLWPWFVGVVLPFYLLIRVLALPAKIIFLPGKIYQGLVHWRKEYLESLEKNRKEEEKSIPRCAYCHKSSGTLERFADPPIYFHKKCGEKNVVFRHEGKTLAG